MAGLEMTLGKNTLILTEEDKAKISQEVDRILSFNNSSLSNISTEMQEAMENKSFDRVETNTLVKLVLKAVEDLLKDLWLKNGEITERGRDEQLEKDFDYFKETGFYNKLEKDIYNTACNLIKQELEELKQKVSA